MSRDDLITQLKIIMAQRPLRWPRYWWLERPDSIPNWPWRCTACEQPFGHSLVSRSEPGDAVLCYECGHLMIVSDRGFYVDLTRANLQELEDDPVVKAHYLEIQREAVKYLIG